MAKKTKAAGIPRKKFAARLADADNFGYQRGWRFGQDNLRNIEFGPKVALQAALSDIVRQVGAWPTEGHGVTIITATDLKSISHVAIPFRTLQAMCTELKRLGYGGQN